MSNPRYNPIFATDGYKPSHYLQDPPGTTAKFSYISARKGHEVLWFGLQAIIAQYLRHPVDYYDLKEAAEFYSAYGVPFNYEGWKRIITKHGGRMPVRIRALPEGMIVPCGVPLATIETVDDELPWVGSWLETLLLRVWYPTTVATRSYEAKKVIRKFLLETADNLDGLPFKLHDFGARGVSSGESAALGGMAHLVNFLGSDTIEGVRAAATYYPDHPNLGPAGFSIPAAEHSTITAWGRENEVDAYRNMLDQFAKPGAIVAVVSDSYDIFHACERLWGQDLRQQVIDSGATVVIRPDSGDPLEVLPKIAAILGNRFGFTTNSKGYHVLNHVRLIQGDGIDSPESIRAILSRLAVNGWSADNIAFGMGGGLLQKCDRDTFGFAMKCSAAKVKGEWRDVFKDPITDSGKASLKGRLTTAYSAGALHCVRAGEGLTWADDSVDAMKTVYQISEAGYPLFEASAFQEVRANTKFW